MTAYFLTGGSSGQVQKSTDGASYTGVTTGFSAVNVYSAAFGKGLFLLGNISGALKSSTDLSSWGGVTLPAGWSGNMITQIGYSSAADLFWICGTAGKFATSPDGASGNWTIHDVGFGSTDVYEAVYGNGIWVVVGDSGKITTSTDVNGTFTARTSQFGTSTIRSVTYGGGVFCAVGASGKMSTAPDSDVTSWTSRTSGFETTQIIRVRYDNSIFVAVGSAGKISTATSATGTWTARTSGIATDIYGVVYGGSTWVATGASNTALTASDPTGTWSSHSLGLANGTDFGFHVTYGALSNPVTGAGSSTGSASAAGAGAANVASTASSVGSSTASATSNRLIAAVGASSGSSTVSGVGDSGLAGFGYFTSTSVSTASATSSSLNSAIGASSGISTASGSSQRGLLSTGASAGVSTASAVGDVGPLDLWKAACAKMRNGVANARILCVGNSTTIGRGSNPTILGGNMRLMSWPSQFEAILANAIINEVGDNFFGGSYNNQTAYLGDWAFDDRITIGSGWSGSTDINTFTLGGCTASASGPTDSFAFTPYKRFDQFKLYYNRGPSNGTLTLNIDGSSGITIDTSGTSGVGVYTGSTTLGFHTINLNWSSGGSVHVIGIEASNSTLKSIEVLNSGCSGTTAERQGDVSTPTSPGSLISILAPDLTIIDLGINDWTTSSSVDNFKAGLQSVITEGKRSGSVVLLTPTPAYAVGTPDATPYLTAIADLATTNNCQLIDLYTAWGGLNAHSLHPTWYYDAYHPNANGYAQIASAVYDLLSSTLDQSAGVAVSTNTSTVLGVGIAASTAAFISSSSSTCTAQGSSNAETRGSVVSTSSVLGVGRSGVLSVAHAEGIASVDGAGLSQLAFAEAVGRSVGSCVVRGRSNLPLGKIALRAILSDIAERTCTLSEWPQ